MSITFSNVHFSWRNLFKNKRDWALLFGVGTPLVMLYNIWLFQFGFDDFGELMLMAIVANRFNVTWGLAFGFAGGVTAHKADIIEQLIMTFIGAYLLYFVSGIFLFFVSVTIYTLGSFLVWYNLILAFPMTLSIGFIPGYLISLWIDKVIYKTAAKEIEEKQYVSYASLDDPKRMEDS